MKIATSQLLPLAAAAMLATLCGPVLLYRLALRAEGEPSGNDFDFAVKPDCTCHCVCGRIPEVYKVVPTSSHKYRSSRYVDAPPTPCLALDEVLLDCKKRRSFRQEPPARYIPRLATGASASRRIGMPGDGIEPSR